MPTLLLTRAHDDNAALAAAVQAAAMHCDVTVVSLPTARFEPVPPRASKAEFTAFLRDHDAVAFTSRRAVDALQTLGWIEALRAHPAVAVVGAGTAAALVAAGVNPRIMGRAQTGTALAAELVRRLGAGASVACLQAQHARPELADGLRAGGIAVSTAVCYRNVAPPPPDPALCERARAADLVYLAAPSAADRVYAWLPELRQRPWVAIGPTTAAAVSARHGHAPVAVAQSPRLVDVADAIAAALRGLTDDGGAAP